MVTREFQHIIEDTVNKIKSINTIDENEYNAKLHRVFDGYISALNTLQDKYPLLAYWDLSKLYIDREKIIAKTKGDVTGKTSLDCISTCENHVFKIGSWQVTQPIIINLREKPNMVICSSPKYSDADYIHDLLLRIILSMPIGEVHISIVNTSMSGIARDFLQQIDKFAFDVYSSIEDVRLINALLSNRFEQRVIKGNIEGPSTQIVVLLDYDWRQRDYKEFLKLFEHGKEAGIHFVVIANEEDISKANERGDNLLKCKNYHLLGKSESLWSLEMRSKISLKRKLISDPTFALTCYAYINQELSVNKRCVWNEELIKDLKSKISKEIENQRIEDQRKREEKQRRENSVVDVTFRYDVINEFGEFAWCDSENDTIDKDVYLSLLQGGSNAIATFIRSQYEQHLRSIYSISNATMKKNF